MSTSISTYCIGLKKNGEEKIIYNPSLQISEIKKTYDNKQIIITVANSTISGISGISGDFYYDISRNPLNTSPSDILNKKIMPNRVVPADFLTNANNSIMIIVLMQFYMNPETPLTMSYTPEQLILMDGFTTTPKPNQKGELMCDVYDNIFIGCPVDNTTQPLGTVIKEELLPGKKQDAPKSGTYNTDSLPVVVPTKLCEFINKVWLEQPMPKETRFVRLKQGVSGLGKSVSSATSAIGTSVSGTALTARNKVSSAASTVGKGIRDTATNVGQRVSQTATNVGQTASALYKNAFPRTRANPTVAPITGGGLKFIKDHQTQPVSQRIYRPVRERRTDYYNYA